MGSAQLGNEGAHTFPFGLGRFARGHAGTLPTLPRFHPSAVVPEVDPHASGAGLGTA